MTLDERIEYLTQNIESLHEHVRDAHDRIDKLDAQERTARRAFLAYLQGMNTAMQEYLEVLDLGDDLGGPGNGNGSPPEVQP